ncbi:MAG: hypothetical protein A2902_00685 [Elusimicrobia bacterium RIFCSPLOWO2_01_FULL_64_13]|nr:MAG: hypothetical protein A2902_00685 [Elusimicrobia bacterium RIFCSPLOWO2_01_FULL_64_13]
MAIIILGIISVIVLGGLFLFIGRSSKSAGGGAVPNADEVSSRASYAFECAKQLGDGSINSIKEILFTPALSPVSRSWKESRRQDKIDRKVAYEITAFSVNIVLRAWHARLGAEETMPTLRRLELELLARFKAEPQLASLLPQLGFYAEAKDQFMMMMRFSGSIQRTFTKEADGVASAALAEPLTMIYSKAQNCADEALDLPIADIRRRLHP